MKYSRALEQIRAYARTLIVRSGTWGRKHPTLVAFLVVACVGTCIDWQVPWTDDARFYVPAAQRYALWLEEAAGGLLHLDVSAFSRTAVDEAFGHNREHPPVGKYVMGVGWLMLHHWTGWLEPIEACRFGVTLLWAWMVALVFTLVLEHWGLLAALIASVGLSSMPRLMFHAHAETLDMPVTALLFATFFYFARALRAGGWKPALAAVVLFALALDTKLNAPFFFIAAVFFWLLRWPPRLTRLELQLEPAPAALVGMLVLSPLLAWAIWPWLWYDTALRLQAYAQFHLQHYNILFYYAGQLYQERVAPWHAPFVLTALTVPVPVLVLTLGGALFAVRSLAARYATRDVFRTGILSADDVALFALIAAATQLVAVSLPGVPVYGGVKLFLPAFPFLSVLAGFGVAPIARWITARAHPLAAAALLLLVLAPGLLGLIAYRGTLLSYYNALAGGARGAAALGFERQYYDLAYADIAEDLARLLPSGGRVAFLPNPKEYTSYVGRWQKRGMLPRNLRIAPPEQADVLVLTHERRWPSYPLLLARYRTKPLLARKSVASVPLYSIFDLRD